MNKIIPKKVFIVPYRNRKEQSFFFCKYMNFILENEKDYEIYFIHQFDDRPFNRGAIKNIGFLTIKKLYPNDYKNIIFVFNDIDCIPYDKIFDYETDIGTICHYYGFTHSLGGIVVITGYDFELINGYPCYWSWGREDFILQKRSENNNLIIDRTNFYELGSPEILQLFDGVHRIINKKDILRSYRDDESDGISTITNLYYTIDKTSKNEKDNNYIIEKDNVYVVNVLNFSTKYNFIPEEITQYDLRKPQREILNNNNTFNNKVNGFIDNNWKNIPYVPIAQEQHIITRNNILQNKKYRLYYPLLPQNTKQQKRQITPRELYSAEYSRLNNIKPMASKSVNISLGGLIK